MFLEVDVVAARRYSYGLLGTLFESNCGKGLDQDDILSGDDGGRIWAVHHFRRFTERRWARGAICGPADAARGRSSLRSPGYTQSQRYPEQGRHSSSSDSPRSDRHVDKPLEVALFRRNMAGAPWRAHGRVLRDR